MLVVDTGAPAPVCNDATGATGADGDTVNVAVEIAGSGNCCSGAGSASTPMWLLLVGLLSLVRRLAAGNGKTTLARPG